MSHRVFHVLTETEPFSRSHAGAISRWVGSTTSADEDTVVLCPDADGSWGFSPSRVRVVPGLARHRTFPQRLGPGIAWSINKHLLANVLARGLRDLAENDIVWLHNRPDSAAALSPYIRSRKAHLVLHMHNSHIAGCPPSMLKDLSPARTVFCSSFLETEALAYWPKLGPTIAVANGADDRVFFPAANAVKNGHGTPLTVLFVGRLVPEKGAHVLVDAMRILLENQIPVRARIIGSASFSSERSSEYVDGLRRNAPANVEFVGFVGPESLGEQFRQADIFCCPSTWNEPFGMTNVEAMATRLPVIATRCGGIPEVFSDGGALLVDPCSPQQIADACQRLRLDPVLRARLAQEGLDSYKKKFTWRAVHKQYRQVAESLWK